MAIIEVRDLDFYYGKFQALRGIGLDIDPAAVGQAKDNLAEWGLNDSFSVLEGDIRFPPEAVAGPFDLSTYTAATLSWDMWVDTESGWDYLWFGASADGSNFDMWGQDGYTAGWVTGNNINLADFYGDGTVDFTSDSSVWIAFYFETDDSSSDYEGAYVDNVRLVAGQTAPDVPTTSIASASATSSRTLGISRTGSSNSTTFGRSGLPQPAHGGGGPGSRCAAESGSTLPQPGQVRCLPSPWISRTVSLPAAWWRPSTFWVTIPARRPARSSRARARWPAFGSRPAIAAPRAR